MTEELQTKLSTAEATATEAGKELEKLQVEFTAVTDALNRPSRDFDAMVISKKRQRQLVELVFDATVAARKANLVVLEVRRDISREAHGEAVRQRQEREPSLDAEIAEIEKKLTGLK